MLIYNYCYQHAFNIESPFPLLFQHRREMRKAAGLKYSNKMMFKEAQKKMGPKTFIGDPTNEIFQTKPPEEAVGEEKQLFIRKKGLKPFNY